VDWVDLVKGQAEVALFCEPGNEHSGSIKCVECLEQLRNCQLLKNDSAQSS